VRVSAGLTAVAAGWWYPQATNITTVATPQYGYEDEDALDGVNNQGNVPGQWYGLR